VRVVCADDQRSEREGEGEVGYVGLGLRYRLPSEVVVSSKRHSFALNERGGDQPQEEEEGREGDDYESLNEWYTEQLSSVVTLHSASPTRSQSQSQSQSHSQYYPQSESESESEFESESEQSLRVPSSPTYYAPARPDSVCMLSPFPRFSFTPPAPAPAPALSSVPVFAHVQPEEKAEAAAASAKPEPAHGIRPLPKIPVILTPHDSTLPRRKQTVVSGNGSVLGLFESGGVGGGGPAPLVVEGEKKEKEYRPLPRTPVPVDLAMDEWADHHHQKQQQHPQQSNNANASVHREVTSPAPTVDLGEFAIENDLPLKFPSSLPTSPVELGMDPVELEAEAEFGVVAGVEMRCGGRSVRHNQNHHQQRPLHARSSSVVPATEHQQQQQRQRPIHARSSSAVPPATTAVRAGVRMPRSNPSIEHALPETPTWDMYSPIPTATSTSSSNGRTYYCSSSDTHTPSSSTDHHDQEFERAVYSRWSASTFGSQLEHHERVMTVKRVSEKLRKNKESVRGSSMFKFHFDFGSKLKKGRRSLRLSSLSTSVGGKDGNLGIDVNPFFAFPSSPRSPRSYMLPSTPPPPPPPSKKEFSVRSRAGRPSNESVGATGGRGMRRRNMSNSSVSTNASGSVASGSVNSECGSYYERQSRKQIPVEMFIKC
jgi:hypothetical protein